MPLFQVSDEPKFLDPIDTQSLSDNQLAETEWVHNWIEKNFSQIFSRQNFELIGREVNVTGSGPEGFLDFLGVDLSTGNIVIIEAKRDDFDNRKFIGQVIEYAAGISRLTKENLNQIYQDYINSSEDTIDNLFIQKSGNLSPLNKQQKIIIVVQNSYKNQGTMLRLKSSCMYLREAGLDINILEIKWYKKGGLNKTPEKDDIIEVNLLWEIEDSKNSNTLVQSNEQSFLEGKTDVAIKLYSFIVKLLDSQKVKYTKRVASKWITFYGKSRAFMVVQFEEDLIKLRLRLGDNYNNYVQILPETHDKLSSSDGFLHQIIVADIEPIAKYKKSY